MTSSLTEALTTAAEALTPQEIERIKDIRFGLYGYFGTLLDSGKIDQGVFYLIVALLVIGAYLLGSLNFAVIISRLKFGEDIRTKGSGNAGATNMSRTYGKAAGVFTLLGDVMKTVVPVLAAKLLVGDTFGYLVGLSCAVGHAFPCYYRFKGGKGVAVTAAIVLVMEPMVFLLLLVIFAVIVAATKYVSLGSVITACIMPILLNNFVAIKYDIKGHLGIFFAILNAVLVVFLHRENIKRLYQGKENKFSFKKKEKQSKKEEN
jgi:glycerol-3-phosphate acyltransferase PlsY